MKKINIKSVMTVLLALFSLSAHSQDQEIVITLKEAGTLKEALSEVEATKIKHLTLKGPIDANDIKLIRAQEGRLSTLEVLDLKDVTELVAKEKVYYHAYGQGFDGVLGGVAHYVCIGEKDESLTETYAYGTRANVYDYFDDLAYAFIDMPLKRIVWPSCLKEIGPAAMHNCKSLEEFVAPTNPEFIGGNAFSGCSELKKIPTLKYVKDLRVQAFENCSLLTVLDEKHEIDLSSLDTIPENAFAYCDQIKSVKFSPNVRVIRTWAFYKCSGITSVVIPNSINLLHDGAFKECASLGSVIIENGVTTIGDNAFEKCIGLPSVVIPNSVTSLGKGAFYGCSSLTSVTIGNNVGIIDESTFWDCSNLTSVTIGNSVTAIDGNAFRGCNITSLTIPNSVMTIKDYAFYSGGLKSVIIGNGITYIGNRTFDNNYMTDVYCYSKDVPEAEYNAFATDVRRLESTTLHVPATSIEAYKSAVAWKDFGKIVAIEGTIVPGDVTGNGSVNVQDATIVVNYILGTEKNEAYDYSAADMNNDGEIDVFDVTKMIAIILSEESSAKMRKVEGVQEPAMTEQLTIEYVAHGIILNVDQANRFTSFQMDVVVPDGIALTEVHLSQNETDHIVRYAKIGENQYRVMALSMNSTPLQVYSDRLLELGMNEGDDVQIDNILFVTPQGEAVPFSILSDNITTDIKTVGISEAEDIYDLSGRKINVNRTQLPKGVYIINKKKVFIK